MKSKKASHIGFVLSFVIFMTSVLFLYTLLVPSLKTDVDKKAAVENLRTELVERISLDLTSLTVTISESVGSGTCLQFVDLIDETGISDEIVIQNEIGQIFTPYIFLSSVYVDRSLNTNSKFFKISVSEGFPPLANPDTGTLSTCTSLNKGVGGYEIGSIRTEKNIFQSKVEGVLEEYRTGYDALKAELKVPMINEFGLGFVYENETLTRTVDPNLNISIYSNRFPVRYIDEEGNKKSGDLEIRVWWLN